MAAWNVVEVAMRGADVTLRKIIQQHSISLRTLVHLLEILLYSTELSISFPRETTTLCLFNYSFVKTRLRRVTI